MCLCVPGICMGQHGSFSIECVCLSLACMGQHSFFPIEVDCLNLCSSECLHLPFAIFNSLDFPCVHVLVPGLRVLCMYTRQHRTTRPWEPESRNQVLGRLHLCLPLPGPIAPDRRMRARRNPAATEPLVAHAILVCMYHSQ